MAMTCFFCGRNFVPRRARKDARYCSTTCRVKAFNQRRLEALIETKVEAAKKRWMEQAVRRLRGDGGEPS